MSNIKKELKKLYLKQCNELIMWAKISHHPFVGEQLDRLKREYLNNLLIVELEK